MKVGLILIGDELLNGSRQDKHMAKTIEILAQRGMKLGWVRIIADEVEQLVQTFKETLATDDIVFSFGGIGATPDDLTRQCAAQAAGVELIKHPKAVELIENQFGEQAYPNRILMSELPEGSEIIPNPINQVPGFTLANHHFVPGFPSMSWPMVEWVLDTHYRHLFDDNPDVDWRWKLVGAIESDLLDMMNTLLETFPEVRLSSLPNTQHRHHIDFGLKGKEEHVAKAAAWFESYMTQHDFHYERQDA